MKRAVVGIRPCRREGGRKASPRCLVTGRIRARHLGLRRGDRSAVPPVRGVTCRRVVHGPFIAPADDGANRDPHRVGSEPILGHRDAHGWGPRGWIIAPPALVGLEPPQAAANTSTNASLRTRMSPQGTPMAGCCIASNVLSISRRHPPRNKAPSRDRQPRDRRSASRKAVAVGYRAAGSLASAICSTSSSSRDTSWREA